MLPLIVLDIRMCLKLDILLSAEELVSGTISRLPEGGVVIHWLYRHALFACLYTCGIFLRYKLVNSDDRYSFRPSSILVRAYLSVLICRENLYTQPEEGSFHVISSQDKTFVIDRLGRVDIVSIGRLTVAYVDDSLLPNSLIFGVNPVQLPDDTSVSRQGP